MGSNEGQVQGVYNDKATAVRLQPEFLCGMILRSVYEEATKDAPLVPPAHGVH